MCTETAAEGHSYTRVKGASLNCPDPSAPPPGSKADTDSKDEDDDDAKADEMMQKMLKQGQEFCRSKSRSRPDPLRRGRACHKPEREIQRTFISLH
jgi:hypothetical protein